MRIEDQFVELVKVKKEINKILAESDLQTYQHLACELDKNRIYKRLVKKDTQLYMLEQFFYIAFQEEKKLVQRGISANVFEGVTSLDILERKYLSINFSMYRLELDLTESELSETISRLIRLKVSGIAMFHIIQCETKDIIENVMKLSKELLKRQEFVNALIMLQEAVGEYPDVVELSVRLANVWMELGEYSEAYKCINAIRKLSPEICNLLNILEVIS